MYDTKHVKIKKIGKLVKNMKDAMRAVMRNGPRSATNENNNQHSAYKDSAPSIGLPRQQRNEHKDSRNSQKFDSLQYMSTLMKEFQNSNQKMLLEMKNSLLSSLR